MESALPTLVFLRQLEYDICFFAWKVLACVILAYYLIEKGIESDSDTVEMFYLIAQVLNS